MARYQITHSRKDGSDPDRRLDGFMIAGKYYKIDQVIAWIINQQHDFYVVVWGRQVDVVARRNALSGRWYLTTEPDGFPPNNLLNLPDC